MVFDRISKTAKAGLAGLLLLGSSMGLGGCAQQRALDAYNRGHGSIQQYEEAKSQDNALALMGAGVLIGGIGVQRGKPEAVYIGEGLQKHGNAIASRDSISQTVNVSPQQVLPVYGTNEQTIQNYTGSLKTSEEENLLRIQHSTLGFVVLATCNYSNDFNSNGFLDFPEDFNGIRKSFYAGEKTTIVLGTSVKTDSLRINLFDRNGDPVKMQPAQSAPCTYASQEFRDLLPGNYASAFYFGNEFLGKLEFNVLGDKEVARKK